ncbi:unnamed protein product [Caenorhabditis brenneri]
MSPVFSLLFGAVLLISLSFHQVGASTKLDNYDYISSRIQREAALNPGDEIAYQHFLEKINQVNEEERKEREEKYMKLPEGWSEKQPQKTQKRAAQHHGLPAQIRNQYYNEFLNIVEKQDAEDQKRYDDYFKAKMQNLDY